MTFDDFLGRIDSVRPDGDGWTGTCPAHSDSHASLHVAVSAAGKVLVACRAGCDTGAVMDALGLSMRDLATMSVGDVSRVVSASRSVEDVPTGEVAALVQSVLDAQLKLTPASRAYARGRFGLSDADIDRIGLGSTFDRDGAERLLVPFATSRGHVRGWQARALDNTAQVRWMGPRNPSAGSWSKLAWFDGVSDWPEVVVTEGPGDALSAVAHGYSSVGIRGAGLAGVELATELHHARPDAVWVIAGDGDSAGRSFAATLGGALRGLGATVKVLEVPDGEDLTSWDCDLAAEVASAPFSSATELALSQRDEQLFPLTDLGNARFVAALAQARGSAVRFVPELGWLVLTDGIWRLDNLDYARVLVHESADAVRTIAQEMLEVAGDDKNAMSEAKRWERWSQYCQSSRGVDSALKELRALPGVATSVDVLDQVHDVVAVRNGLVNLRDGSLMPHDPSMLLTKRLNMDYDPSAECPRWERFLSEIMCGDEDMVAFLRRLVGYSLTGLTSEQAFAILWGSGANGKSVFTGTLSSVFGPYCENTPFSTFEMKPAGGVPNDVAALRGARMVFASEGEANRLMAESLLKRLTGSDPVTARFMRREFFTFHPTFMLFLATNNKPNFRGQDEGLWRRVKMIKFGRYFAPDERDHRLQQRLVDEGQGILAWAVRGAVEWFSQGLGEPAAVVEATADYRATSDPLAGFLPGVLVPDPTAKRMSGRDLYDLYVDWTREEGLNPKEVWTRRYLFSALEERGFVKVRAKTGNAFEGLRRSRSVDSEVEKPPVLRAVGGPSLEEV